MPSHSNPASAKDIRRLAMIQLGITAAFLVIIFRILGGTDADYPPVWISVLLMVAVAVGVFFSERVWLSGTPLDPAEGSEVLRNKALEAYANQTVRKLIYTEAPMLLAVVICFVGNWGGWPVLIIAIPGLAAQAWETWPHLRNTSMSAAILDSKGAESQLVESFIAT